MESFALVEFVCTNNGTDDDRIVFINPFHVTRLAQPSDKRTDTDTIIYSIDEDSYTYVQGNIRDVAKQLKEAVSAAYGVPSYLEGNVATIGE